MRKFFYFLHILLFAGLFVVKGQQNEYSKAKIYLDKKGEVYFTFYIKSSSEIEELTKIISIDNVKNLQVFAYANREQFEKFILLNYNYSVLLPPGNQIEEFKSFDIDTKVSFDFTSYPTYDQYLSLMQQFETEYPDICKIIERGNSVDNRKILFAKISDNVSTSENEPRFMFTSTMHGDETGGYVLMLRLINYLLENYNTDQEISDLVDNLEIWINPLLNPDGTYTNDNSTVQGATRGNANNIDLNRNFPDFLYGQHPDGYETQPETQAIISLHNDYNFTISGNFHAGLECVAYPWFTTTSSCSEEQWFENVGTEYASMAQQNSPSGYFTSFGDGVTKGSVIIAHGTISDYLTYYQNCRDITIEISNIKLLPENQLDNFWNYNYRSMLAYIDNIYDIACFNNLLIRRPISDESREYLANNSIIASNIISNGANIHCGASTRILLQRGFRVYPGCHFIADLNGCNSALKSAEIEDGSISDNYNDPTYLNDEVLKPNIYPNPTKGSFIIELNRTINSPINIEITNIMGSVVYKKAINQNGKHTIDLANQPNGIYIIRIFAENDIHNYRIIKE